MKSSLLLSLIIISFGFSQKRVLLHINEDGDQEKYNLEKDQSVFKAIEGIEFQKSFLQKTGLIDTLKYYSNETEINTRFGFRNFDVALQWYAYPSEGTVKELWWKSGDSQWLVDTSTIIRLWRINKKMFDIPTNAFNSLKGMMGFYNDKNGLPTIVTPFVEESDSIYRAIQGADTAFMVFDPLGIEADWKPNGVKVNHYDNEWQRIVLDSLGKSFHTKILEPFGFTVQNISDPDIGIVPTFRLFSKEIDTTTFSSQFSNFHSLKFYTFDGYPWYARGWYIRNYEWGMYVVIEPTTDGPNLIFNFIDLDKPIIKAQQKKISVAIKYQLPPAMPTAPKEAWLKYKVKEAYVFETLPLIQDADTFSAILPPLPGDKTIQLYIVAYDTMGNRFHSELKSFDTPTYVKRVLQKDISFGLSQNYPNPFNPSTTITFSLPQSEFASLKMFDVLGREIKTLMNEKLDAGTHSITLNAFDLPSGVYFYRLHAGSYVSTQKMLLLK